jgi:hypothetical protein
MTMREIVISKNAERGVNPGWKFDDIYLIFRKSD